MLQHNRGSLVKVVFVNYSGLAAAEEVNSLLARDSPGVEPRALFDERSAKPTGYGARGAATPWANVALGRV